MLTAKFGQSHDHVWEGCVTDCELCTLGAKVSIRTPVSPQYSNVESNDEQDRDIEASEYEYEGTSSNSVWRYSYC